MKIAIIKRSELNGCFSALQYTGNCHLCEKVLTCNVRSEFHKDGALKALEDKEKEVVAYCEQQLTNLKNHKKLVLKNLS